MFSEAVPAAARPSHPHAACVYPASSPPHSSHHQDGAHRRLRAGPDLWTSEPGPGPAPEAVLRPAARHAARPGSLPRGRLPALPTEEQRDATAAQRQPEAPRPLSCPLRQGHGQPGPRPPQTSAASRGGLRGAGGAETRGRAPRLPPAATGESTAEQQLFPGSPASTLCQQPLLSAAARCPGADLFAAPQPSPPTRDGPSAAPAAEGSGKSVCSHPASAAARGA